MAAIAEAVYRVHPGRWGLERSIGIHQFALRPIRGDAGGFILGLPGPASNAQQRARSLARSWHLPDPVPLHGGAHGVFFHLPEHEVVSDLLHTAQHRHAGGLEIGKVLAHRGYLYLHGLTYNGGPTAQASTNGQGRLDGNEDAEGGLTLHAQRPYAPSWNRIDFLTAGLRREELETARTAYELGYYDDSRDCTMEEIASQEGISKASVHNRLKRVTRVALERMFSSLFL